MITMMLIVFAVAFTVAMTILMIRPFSASRSEQMTFELLDEEERKIEALVARKVALIQSLRDTEYDWKTNKISEEDYRRFKKSCERQAVGIMRKLDRLHGGERDWDQVIDQAVSRRLGDHEGPPVDTTSVDANTDGTTNAHDDEPVVSPDADSPGDSPQCSSCGHSLAPDDRFCSQCGAGVPPADSDSLPGSTGDDLDSRPSSPSEVAG